MAKRFGSVPDRTFRAVVTMKPTSEGGIKAGFDCPVLSFFHRSPEAPADTLWMVITPEDGRQSLSPGDADVEAALSFFWLDQDISHVRPGTDFDVWYVDRVVGHGRIL